LEERGLSACYAAPVDQLIADDPLTPHLPLLVHDPRLFYGSACDQENVTVSSLAETAACRVVLLACPVETLEVVTKAISPHLRPGAVVLDVGSVKMIPAEIMCRNLPEHVGIVGTHPLFGPQSARDGIRGLKIAICPIGVRTVRVSQHSCAQHLGSRLFSQLLKHTTARRPPFKA